MFETPPGPDRDAALAELRGLMDAMQRELSGPPPFPVFGLDEPHLAAATLAASEQGDTGWHMITLHYGDSFSASGPFVSIRSERLPEYGDLTRQWPDAAYLIADERDRLFDHAAIEEPEPQQAETLSASLAIEGRELPLELRREDSIWAAILDPATTGAPDVRVAVVSRGVPIAEVRLARVTDLTPYWAGREEFMLAMAERHRDDTCDEDLDLPVTEGFTAHHELLAVTMPQAVAMAEAARQGRRMPRLPRDFGRRWEGAVRAQMRLAGDDRASATEAVTSLVNHMNALTGLEWFADETLKGVAETLRWLAFASDVDSTPAQQAWDDRWGGRTSYLPHRLRTPPEAADSARGEDIEARFVLLADAEQRWQAAWETWVDHQR